MPGFNPRPRCETRGLILSIASHDLCHIRNLQRSNTLPPRPFISTGHIVKLRVTFTGDRDADMAPQVAKRTNCGRRIS